MLTFCCFLSISNSAFGETKAVILDDESESNPKRRLASNSEG